MIFFAFWAIRHLMTGLSLAHLLLVATHATHSPNNPKFKDESFCHVSDYV